MKYGLNADAEICNATINQARLPASPVSVWNVDHDGWLVRIQPLD
jgi:hypothetical protein